MAQYISKDALVAEINRLRKSNEQEEDKDYAQFELDVSCGYDMALDDVEKSLNTIEVKEVDLDTAIQIMCNSDYYKRHIKHSPYVSDTINYTAKYFFELGLKTQKGE